VPTLLEARWKPPAARAAAFLYADRGPITAPELAWPPWSADRPRPGCLIAEHQPLATVVAEDTGLAGAEQTCHERLGLLEKLLYEGTKMEGTPR
jgi:predicted ATP-grasp superfamily ATP-dependent carboligase